jgi:hypothetical protein
MGEFQAGLADPDNRPLAAGTGGEGEAGQGWEISVGSLADFMQADLTEPEGKGRKRLFPERGQTEKVLQRGRGRSHLFIICSYRGESTNSIDRKGFPQARRLLLPGGSCNG